MKQLRTVAAFAIVALLSFALVGCGSSNQASSSAGASGSTTAANDAQVKVVTDAYGRTVEVPATVETAATVGSGARFVVYAGGQDKLIAATELDVEPQMHRPYTIAFESLFSTLPTTSNGNHLLETTVNTEELMNLNPDVIISSRSAQECDDLQSTIGIPVIGITYQNQLFTENVYNSIECVGEALGTEAHAQQVIAKMQEWQADLTARSESVPEDERPTVYVGGINYKTPKSWGGTSAEYAPCVVLGANNVADQAGQSGSFDVDIEQIAEWNPDYMFLNADNFDLMKQEYDANPEFFDSLLAFQNNNLYTQPFFNFNGTNVDTGICDTYFIGATIYPEAFADVDLDAMYTEIYETMLDGFNFYEVMQEKNITFGHFPALS